MIFPKFRLPDRTLGLLSRPDQEKLPTLLQHQHYCELIQRTICTALSSFKLYSSPTSIHLPILLSTLVSVHPEHLSPHLWKFLAAFASTSSDCATLTSAIVSSLDSTASEKVGRRRRCPLFLGKNPNNYSQVLLSALSSKLGACQLNALLGSHLTSGTRFVKEFTRPPLY